MIPGIVAQASTGQSASSVPHRYWRVFISSPQATEPSWTSICRLEMYSSQEDGGARVDRTIGKTPIYSSQGGLGGGETAANAFTDLNNLIWATSAPASNRFNCYLGCDFGAGNEIVIDRFALQARESGSFTLTQTPMDFRLEYSDDGSNWATAFTVASQTGWTRNEMRLFTSPDYSPTYSGSPHGAHRYWRIHPARANDGGITYSAAEVEMRATPGGADQCNGGTPTAHSNFGGTPGANDAPKAFDNNAATLWSANGNAADGWLKYDFGTPVEVAEVMIRARNDASFGQTPRWGQIEFSDDNNYWSVAWEYAMASTYSAGLAQSTTDPNYV